MADDPPPDISEGAPDGRPGIGLCVDCKRARRKTWEIESSDQRLCLDHIRGRIRRATWPDPPEME